MVTVVGNPPIWVVVRDCTQCGGHRERAKIDGRGPVWIVCHKCKTMEEER